jgi:hypothetical protein
MELNMMVLMVDKQVVLILDHETIDIKNRQFRSLKKNDLNSGVVLIPGRS